MPFKGTNKLGSRDTFISRVFYSCYAYSTDGAPNVNPSLTKDLLTAERLFYGRTNQSFYAITPRRKKLTNISSDPLKPALVLDFVADAYHELQREFINAMARGDITTDTSIGDARSGLSVMKAATDPQKNYKMHIQAINANFLEFVDEPDIRKIHSFETFFPFYMDYIKKITTAVPMTKGSYITSVFNSPMNSGLCIEIASRDHSVDADKYDVFIKDRNFEAFKVMAAKYGFVIDKNAPWRLIADLGASEGSNAMIDYATRKNSNITSTDEALGYYYEMAYHSELEDFKSTVIKAYNVFAYSNIVSYEAEIDNEVRKTRVITPEVGSEEILKRFSDHFWLEYYILTRNYESKLDYSQPALNRIIKNARELRKTFDIRKALGYIERKFNGFTHSEGSLFYDVAKADLAEQQKTASSVAETVRRATKVSKIKAY